jgi:hydroxymethylbilane synthase
MRLKIGARRSDLARLQAYQVGSALKSLYPQIEIIYQFKSSLGDLNQENPLWKMPEKGVFTEDFKKDLLDGTCDLVVHSFKDLPVDENSQSEIVASLPRADARDLILLKHQSLELKKSNLKIFSSSPRRIHHLGEFLGWALPYTPSKVSFESVRGNIATRIAKYISGYIDGLIVAKAAIDRLLEAEGDEFRDSQKVIREAFALSHWIVVPLQVSPPAPAQGALAIEILRSRADLKKIIAGINDVETFQAANDERKILSDHGGGCHQKIGAYYSFEDYGRLCFIRGLTDQGVILDKAEILDQEKWPKAQSLAEIFPHDPLSESWFEREKIGFDAKSIKDKNAFFVARAPAWPDHFRAPKNSVIWTSGLKTWKNLALDGHFINGSCEGLGEDENRDLKAFEKIIKLNWVKFSHTDSASFSDMPLEPTYKLKLRSNLPNPRAVPFYFWMSPSTFLAAEKMIPGLSESGFHACGPGHTYHFLKKTLKSNAKLKVFLDFAAWKTSLLGEDASSLYKEPTS